MPPKKPPVAKLSITVSSKDLSASVLYDNIRSLLVAAKTQVRQTVNTAMVQTYWQVGRLIVEREQGGEKRAAYGARALEDLGQRLITEFGAGFLIRISSSFASSTLRSQLVTRCVTNPT